MFGTKADIVTISIDNLNNNLMLKHTFKLLEHETQV